MVLDYLINIPDARYNKRITDGKNVIEIVLLKNNELKVILNIASYKSIHMFNDVNDKSFVKFVRSVKHIVQTDGFTVKARLSILGAMSWI